MSIPNKQIDFLCSRIADYSINNNRFQVCRINCKILFDIGIISGLASTQISVFPIYILRAM